MRRARAVAKMGWKDLSHSEGVAGNGHNCELRGAESLGHS